MEGTLVFTKLPVDLSLLSTSATFLVKVDEELKWTSRCRGVQVDIGQCSAITSIPTKLTSIRIVLDLLSTLPEVAVCQGNSVENFR